MKNQRRTLYLFVSVVAILAIVAPTGAATTPKQSCVATSELDDSFRDAMLLLSANNWQAAAKKFESVLTMFEAPAAAIYAAYSYAKLADFDSARTLLNRAKTEDDCLNATEVRQLNWLIEACNEATTIPKVYYGSSGGTLSIGQRDTMKFRRDIERKYSESLSACDRQEALDIGLSMENRTSKTECVAKAKEFYKELRSEYLDPCGAVEITPRTQEAVKACVNRYNARRFGVYEPVTVTMPDLPKLSETVK